MEGGDPACAAEEGIREDFFTGLKADETFIEAQDVCAVDLDIFSNEVKKVCVVEETACAVLPENPRYGVSVFFGVAGLMGDIGKILLTGYEASDP